MKTFAKIFIILTLLLGAGEVWAIDLVSSWTDENGVQQQVPRNRDGLISLPISNLGPESLASPLYTDTHLRASRGGQNRTDLAAIDEELAIRADLAAGRITEAGATQRREASRQAFFSGGAVVGGEIVRGNLAQQEKLLPSCDFGDGFVGCVILRTVAWLLWWIVRLFSLLVMLANQVFNLAIDISVRQFKSYAGLEGVKSAWTIFRDLVNLSFIFVLLYVAIGTILQLNSVNGKNLLKNVIIAALLVNFSFFFTGIIIDASNIVANQFYSMAGGENPTGVNGAPDITTSLIAGMNKSYYEDIIAWNGNDSDSNLRQFGSILTSYAGRIILMLITATILFAGAVMFFIRTIVLIFVLVLSPVAFLGFAVGGEGLGKLAKRWQSALTNQVIFAPVYLLLIFMTIKLVNSDGIGNAANSGAVGSLVVFGIINGMMLGSLMVAKELGVAGAALGTKLGGGITGFGTKLLGRPIGGILGATYNAVAKRAAPEGGIIARGGESFKRLTLQAKKIPGVKEFTETLGEGRVIKRAAKAVVTEPGRLLNEGIAGVTDIKIMGQTRDDEKETAKRLKEEKELKDDKKRKEKADEIEQIAGNTPKETVDRPLSEKERVIQEEHEKKVQEVSDKDIVKIDSDTLVKLAHLLAESQMTALRDGKDGIDPKKFAEIKRAREELLRESIKEGKADIIEKEIDKMSNKALANFIAELDEKDTDQFGKTIQAIADNIDDRILGELSKVGGARRTRLAQIARRMPNQGVGVPGGGSGRNPTNATNNPGRPTNLPPGASMSPGGIIIP